MTAWENRSISDIAPEIRQGRLSPVELTQAALDRIKAEDGILRTFITVGSHEAIAAARQAEDDIQAGRYRGPLHGVPVALKDNLAVAGWPTTNGSPIAADWVTSYDSTAAQRLRAAGAVIVGKNNMHEWALGSTSWGGHFGSVRNPWRHDCIAGGSSGGSAACVSAGFVYASIGTDGMGSIRVPAAFCGVVGLKPSYGLVSRFGALPPTSRQEDHVGPICRTVSDVALLLNALAGADPLDPTSRSFETRDYTCDLECGVDGLRVGVPENCFFEDLHPEVAQAVGEVLHTLEQLGASSHRVVLPSVKFATGAFSLLPTELTSFHASYLHRDQDYLDREIFLRLLASQFLVSGQIQLGMMVRNRIRREFAEVMQQVDLLVVPTVPVAAFSLDDGSANGKSLSAALDTPLGQHRLLTRLTVPFNFTGMPAVSVPCGFTSQGLPIGVQFAGRRGEDHRLLQAARAYERESGVHHPSGGR